VGAVSSRGTDFRIIQVTDRTAAATLANAKHEAAKVLADADAQRAAASELRRNAEEQLHGGMKAGDAARQAVARADAARLKAEQKEKQFDDKINRLTAALQQM